MHKRWQVTGVNVIELDHGVGMSRYSSARGSGAANLWSTSCGYCEPIGKDEARELAGE